MQSQAQLDNDDPAILEYLRIAAPVAALIVVALVYQSAGWGSWSPAVAEWLRFIAAGGLLPFPLAAYCVADGWLGLRRASAAVHWPCARGTIEASDVGPSFGSYYVSRVSYRYKVDGDEFVAADIQSVRIAYSSETLAREVAARYPVGAGIDVRYDPQRPWSSLLELGNEAARRRMFIGAVCFAGPVLFATLAAWANSLR
jgi:hypothetical protein